MTPEKIKAKMQEGFDKIQPKIVEMTSIIMDAYQEGFNTRFELLTGQKFLDNKSQCKTVLETTKEENVDNQNCVKTTNKVESKFNVGDWVTCDKYGAKDIDKIVKFDNDKVIFESGEWLYINQLNEDYKLWTIHDAKPGDVLVWDNSKCITLFKNIYDKESFNSYGFVGYCTESFESRLYYHDIEGAHPATKEQRDILFAKMKKAGYEWDTEKKILSKRVIDEGKSEIDYCFTKMMNGEKIIEDLKKVMEGE